MKKLYLISFFITLFLKGKSQPGATCSEAVVIDTIPYVATGLTTVGTSYNSLPCSGSGFANYMSGKDYLFTITPNQTANFTIKLTNTSPAVGLFVTNSCPDDPNVQCVSYSTSPLGNPSLTTMLTQGQTYYIIISSINFTTPQTNFDIRIDTCSTPPVALFTYQQNGLEVTFTNQSQNATSYLWFFGDELLPPPYSPGDTTTNPTHTYVQYGTYQVTLIAYNSCGMTDTMYQQITLECPYEMPVANFTYQANELNVSFINQSTNATSYQWYFGDELIPLLPSDTTENPTHTYQQYGEYNVTLIACNECGCDTLTQVIAIECPTSMPIAAFTYQQIDENGTVAFTDLSNNATSWQWFFGDYDFYPFLPGDSVQNPVHTYLISGTYTVHLIACNECGCDTTQQDIYVNVVGIYSTNYIFDKINNPVHNIIILPQINGTYNYSIYDVHGTILTSGKLNNSNIINVSILSEGIYYLKLTNDKQNKIYKIVKVW